MADRTTRATASQATSSSVDSVTVTAGPASLLVPFKGLTYTGDTPGIQVGDQFYPNPSPGGSGRYLLQWLTPDRSTLAPIKTGNSWFDGSAGGDHGLQALTSALSSGTVNQLVVLSFPRVGTAGPAVQPDQVDGFNQAMKTIGVGPIDPGLLNEQGQKLVIMGIPYSGDGSGWYTHGVATPSGEFGRLRDAFTGWLVPDAARSGSGTLPFRFQPERPEFDTSSQFTPTTNTMTLRDQPVTLSLPAGATGGFHVVVVDPIDFTVLANAVFPTNGVADPVSALAALENFLNAPANSGPGYHLAVQSIGHVEPPPVPDRVAWVRVSKALKQYGANPDTFNTLDGSYAFFGGRQLDKSEMAESSSTVVIGPHTTPPILNPRRTEIREHGEDPAVAVFALGQVELHQQVADVGLDGAFAQVYGKSHAKLRWAFVTYSRRPVARP